MMSEVGMDQPQQAENEPHLGYYCKLFAQLEVNRTKKRGNAPYKPILLLSVIELIAQGIIKENRICVSSELIETFNKYWNLLNSVDFKGGIALPFFHLQNDGFWMIQFKNIHNGIRPQTNNKLKEVVEYATLDRELFALIQKPTSRKELVDVLVNVWFSEYKSKIEIQRLTY